MPYWPPNVTRRLHLLHPVPLPLKLPPWNDGAATALLKLTATGYPQALGYYQLPNYVGIWLLLQVAAGGYPPCKLLVPLTVRF